MEGATDVRKCTTRTLHISDRRGGKILFYTYDEQNRTGEEGLESRH